MRASLVLLALAVATTAAPPEPRFRAVTIDDKIQIGYGVAVADVDGDGRPDVLLADKRQIVWYRNPAADTTAAPAAWSKFIIAENLTEKDNVCLAAQDLDGDGKCEIAVGAEWNPADTEKSGAVFYLIPPADRTQRWEPVKFPAVEPTTHRMKWVRLGDRAANPAPRDGSAPKSAAPTVDARPDSAAWGLVVLPLHGRGNKNGEGAPVKVLCYQKPADPRVEWKAEVVDESMHMTHNFHVPIASRSAVQLAGKEGVFAAAKFPGSASWTRVDISEFGGIKIGDGGVGELRGGRSPNREVLFCTVEPMHGNSLIAYTLTAAGIRSRHVLTDQLAEGHALACGDLLGAGSDQIVVGWRGKAGPADSTTGVAVWTPLDEKSEQWRETLLDRDGMACEDLILADLNGDGQLDIVASGRATKNVKIYFNDTEK